VESYLDHHAGKLLHRFDAGSYVRLTEMMNSHDVGRDRGGIAAGLSMVKAPTLVAGVGSDRLYPIKQQEELASGIPGAGELREIDSPHGHDAFLIEAPTVGAMLTDLLER
jgi:homoserine O-acetyltransferase